MNRFYALSWCFHCWLCASKCRLGRCSKNLIKVHYVIKWFGHSEMLLLSQHQICCETELLIWSLISGLKTEYPNILILTSEAVVQRCSVKKLFLETSQNSQENTCARSSFLISLLAGLRPATLLNKRFWHRCFLVNFVKFLRTAFFVEHLRWLFLLPVQSLSSTYYAGISWQDKPCFLSVLRNHSAIDRIFQSLSR